ncbi:chymotrypsin-like protease CTRL-1 [Chironomus tepperi]|uniref:chymotrypsin-like protease CTRL-1 n=1 Tax=Chironomus tepperi TaxID=113505 RepID=UPI00391FA7AF
MYFYLHFSFKSNALLENHHHYDRQWKLHAYNENEIAKKADHVIIDTENINSENREGRAINAAATYRLACPGLNECVALRDCPQLLVEATSRCYNSDRSLFCGANQNYEPFICCPVSYTTPSFQGESTNTNNVNNYQDKLSGACGKALIQGNYYKKLGAFPFAARVGFKNLNTGNLVYPCTGSIISRRVILTAAHCALAKADGHRLSSVRIGEFDYSKDPDCAESGFCAPPAINHAISHVVVHPDYINGQYHHDIALLILRTPINYTISAQPICLQRDRTGLTVGKRATVIGWGKISLSNVRSSEMQYLELPLASWDQCLRVYGSSGALDSQKSIEGQWMCAGGEGKDVCSGFGGSSLFITENSVSYQIGIMSFGSENCGGLRIPSVYTSVAHFYNWIQDNVPVE